MVSTSPTPPATLTDDNDHDHDHDHDHHHDHDHSNDEKSPPPANPQPDSESDAFNEYHDAERNFQPLSPKFWSVMVGLYLAMFLVGLDRLIIATAVPRITDEFGSIGDIGWYGSAYMLTNACSNLVFGRIYQLYSTKLVFLVSLVIFEAGSALCAAAPTSAAFIAGRAFAGLGSAGLFAGNIMVIIPLVPLRKRPIFTAMFGIVFSLSSVLGPIVGGTLTDNVTWRWCFYLNLPIGGFTMLVIIFFLHIDPPPKREKLTVFAQIKRLDPIGVVFFVPSMVSLILALQWGGSTFAWSAPRIIGLLATFAVTLVAFVVVEALTPATAMAPARVVLNRSIAGSMAFMFLLSGAMMTVIYYLTIWFQAAQGLGAMEAGIHTLPLVLGLVVMSILAAVFTQRLGYYVPAMLLSPVLTAVGAGMLSTLTPGGSPSSHWIGYQVLYGLGIGSGFQCANLAAQNVLPRADVPLGLALMFFTQQLGGSVFLSVGQNIFSVQLVDGLAGVAGLDAQQIVNTGATNLRGMVPPSELGTVVEAYSFALTRTFVLAAALSAATVLAAAAVEWKSIKKAPGAEVKTAVRDPEDAAVSAEETKEAV
ncbi:major facilitator superfamily domain-containing protein [Lasiosphaeria ovina]|uniref:Major facilitator superfamily domain-containing protein n=1 Tax=Lasiosphaeria ovina TaxID=92902 RepID=A0AAE0NNH8_9PEZI|nr:major facilitator superfamily domain-containing protein [Lasiosphaeria ovina]